MSEMFHTNRQSSVRAAVAIVYLSCLVLFAVYTATPWLLPFGSGAKATSLRLVAAKSHATLGENIQITIVSVSDDGKLDAERNDLVELSTNSDSRARLSPSRITLARGKAEITLVDNFEEPVVVTVRWVSGKTILRGDSVLIKISGR
ncbi:hypothetical protein MUP59_07875 [Candidatus Bathyarchaeota archaeon]|nr:hypothetical protein [Candidatus Bathyarchaeota archaeon]